MHHDMFSERYRPCGAVWLCKALFAPYRVCHTREPETLPKAPHLAHGLQNTSKTVHHHLM
jgi:hypothetical protein